MMEWKDKDDAGRENIKFSNAGINDLRVTNYSEDHLHFKIDDSLVALSYDEVGDLLHILNSWYNTSKFEKGHDNKMKL